MAHPLHKNDTGSFQELAHKSDIEFGQLSLLTIAPGCSRGGHYHTYKREWFCCLHGQCCIVTADIRSKQWRGVILDDANREFIIISPYEAHVVINTGDQECELLVITSDEYDPDNPDTIKFEMK